MFSWGLLLFINSFCQPGRSVVIAVRRGEGSLEADYSSR